MKRQGDRDERWMKLALLEAAKGSGYTSPNPTVGAVLVKQGKLLAKGYHHRAGLPHAEIEALKQVSNPTGATLYVTLEPCCHLNKRTPPCVEAILNSGIQEVVIGCQDPNPQVAGKGIKKLKSAGLKVRFGILEEECRAINLFYNHWIVQKKPYVILKSASTLDGKIALANGKSQWITGEEARNDVHELRGLVDAVLVGIGTVLTDDPQLTARRHSRQKQPIRVVLDPQLKFPRSARMLRKPIPSPVWILTSSKNRNSKKVSILRNAGVEIFFLPVVGGRFTAGQIVRFLGEKTVVSLLVEGGSSVLTRFYQARAFQEWKMFLAPKMFGENGISILMNLALKKIPSKNTLKIQEIRQIGEDILLNLVQL